MQVLHTRSSRSTGRRGAEKGEDYDAKYTNSCAVAIEVRMNLING